MQFVVTLSRISNAKGICRLSYFADGSLVEITTLSVELSQPLERVSHVMK